MAKEKKSAVKAATLAVSIALVTVFTTVVKIPTGGGGYLNCSDVAIAFIAYTLGPVTAFVAGGVGANSMLREKLETRGKEQDIKIFYPVLKYCTDNAAMIGSAGYYYIKDKKGFAELDLTAKPNVDL